MMYINFNHSSSIATDYCTQMGDKAIANTSPAKNNSEGHKETFLNVSRSITIVTRLPQLTLAYR